MNCRSLSGKLEIVCPFCGIRHGHIKEGAEDLVCRCGAIFVYDDISTRAAIHGPAYIIVASEVIREKTEQAIERNRFLCQ